MAIHWTLGEKFNRRFKGHYQFLKFMLVSSCVQNTYVSSPSLALLFRKIRTRLRQITMAASNPLFFPYCKSLCSPVLAPPTVCRYAALHWTPALFRDTPILLRPNISRLLPTMERFSPCTFGCVLAFTTGNISPTPPHVAVSSGLTPRHTPGAVALPRASAGMPQFVCSFPTTAHIKDGINRGSTGLIGG